MALLRRQYGKPALIPPQMYRQRRWLARVRIGWGAFC